MYRTGFCSKLPKLKTAPIFVQGPMPVRRQCVWLVLKWTTRPQLCRIIFNTKKAAFDYMDEQLRDGDLGPGVSFYLLKILS